MASYPLAAPFLIERPAAGQAYVDAIAPALAEVRAPEAGELAYVGDGTAAPFNQYSPGVVVMWGQRSNLLHVFGFIDRAYVDNLRAAGVWGWTGGRVQTGTLDPLVPDGLVDLNDTIRDVPGLKQFFDFIGTDSPPQRPRPRITEGQAIGRVAPSRGHLRWTTIASNAAPRSPLVWAEANGLPLAKVVPPPAPPPPPGAQSGGGLGLLGLALAYFVAEELL